MVFERGVQFTLLEQVPNTFMWVSPIPQDLKDKYDLIERKCDFNTKTYKDVLIYRKKYHPFNDYLSKRIAMKIGLSDHFTYGKLLRFTLPSIGMMIFTSIYGVVDGFFVSNFAGDIPFKAVNLIMPFLMIFGTVGFIFGIKMEKEHFICDFICGNTDEIFGLKIFCVV